MLSPKPIDQIEHGGGGALLLDVTQRIAAVLDLAPQLARLVAGVRGAPHGGVADGIGALASGAGRVSEDEGPRPVGSDAGTEAGNVGVDGDGLALLDRKS